jgi:hypothetical protein
MASLPLAPVRYEHPGFQLIPMMAVAASKAAASPSYDEGSMQTARQLFEP